MCIYIGNQKRNLKSTQICMNFNSELNFEIFYVGTLRRFVRMLANHLSLKITLVAKYKELFVKFIRKCSVPCLVSVLSTNL